MSCVALHNSFEKGLTMLGALFLFAVALLLALVEIEIEGKFGWAEKLPTWYRTTGPAGKLWGLMTSGKPLTGYHLFMNALILLMFHFCFVDLEWSLQKELMVLARFSLVACFWDFLWFALNPFYGIKNYKRKNVWWFAKSCWILGFFPLDYVGGLAFSVLLAYLSGGVESLTLQLGLIGFFLVFTFVSIVLSPLYGR